MAKTYQPIVEGEWQAVPREWNLSCCDCGLVHTFKFRVRPSGGKRAGLEVAIFRNERASAQVRRHKVRK